MIAASSPARMLKLTPATRQRAVRPVRLRHGVELEHRRSIRDRHDAGTTMRRPAESAEPLDLDESLRVVEQARLDGNQPVRAAGLDHLDRIATAGQRQQRVDGDDQNALDDCGRDRDVDRRLIETAGRIRIVGRDVDLDRRRARSVALVARRRRRDGADERHAPRRRRVVRKGDRDRIADLHARLLRGVECDRDHAPRRRDAEHRPGLHRRSHRRRHGGDADRSRLEHDRAEQQPARHRQTVRRLEGLDCRRRLGGERCPAAVRNRARAGSRSTTTRRRQETSGSKRAPRRHAAVAEHDRLSADGEESPAQSDDAADGRQHRVPRRIAVDCRRRLRGRGTRPHRRARFATTRPRAVRPAPSRCPRSCSARPLRPPGNPLRTAPGLRPTARGAAAGLGGVVASAIDRELAAIRDEHRLGEHRELRCRPPASPAQPEARTARTPIAAAAAGHSRAPCPPEPRRPTCLRNRGLRSPPSARTDPGVSRPRSRSERRCRPRRSSTTRRRTGRRSRPRPRPPRRRAQRRRGRAVARHGSEDPSLPSGRRTGADLDVARQVALASRLGCLEPGRLRIEVTPGAAADLSCAPPPVNVGSGKSGTPCERMQAENASRCCCILANCCGLGCPPFGSTFWQACCAARNFGEFGSIPDPGPIEMPPPLLGSGKFGTPCERMHAENLAASAVFNVRPAPPPELELVDGPRRPAVRRGRCAGAARSEARHRGRRRAAAPRGERRDGDKREREHSDDRVT